MTKSEFVSLLRQYNYPEKSIENLWGYTANPEEFYTEDRVKETCEKLSPLTDKLTDIRKMVDEKKDPIETIRQMIELSKMMKKDNITKERFYELYRKDGYPEELIKGFWETVEERNGCTEADAVRVMGKLNKDPEVILAKQIAKLMDAGFIKRPEKEPKNLFPPITKEQLN